MNLSREEYEAKIAELATRVEVAGLSLDQAAMKQRIEEISKRCLKDGDMFSSIFLGHDERIKKLEKRLAKSNYLQ